MGKSYSPLAFVAGLTALSALAYVPLALAFSPWDWASFGPLSLQQSRPLHYAIYFFAAFAIGSYGLDRGLLRGEGPLARHWLTWLAAATICACAWGGLTSLTLPDWNASPFAYRLAAAASYPLACATGTLAYLAIALRLLRARDHLLDSLSNNAYGIYLVHYVFVLWLQYALVGHALNAVPKMIIVFSVALVASWATSGLAGMLIGAAAKALKAPARQDGAIPPQNAVVDRTP